MMMHMAKKDDKKSGKSSRRNLNEKTRDWILAILFFLASFVFLFAGFGKAGVLGTSLYAMVSFLFGIGYFLFPVVFLWLGSLFIRHQKPFVVLTSIAGEVLLFFSILGLLSIAGDKGGVIGDAITSFLIAFIDLYATVVLLLALLAISLLLSFDTTPSFGWLKIPLKLFSRNKNVPEYEEEPVEDEEMLAEDVAEDLEENMEAAEEAGDEDAKENSGGLAGIFALGKQKRSGKQAAAYSPVLQGSYTPPPLSLLDGDKGKPGFGDIKGNSNIIKRTLQNFGIDVEMDEVSVGPSITRYALKPAQGVKLSRIVGLQNDLSLALAAHPIRIEAPIPGKSLVGIEIPNSTRTTVGLSSLLYAKEFSETKHPLLISIGRDITGKPLFGNLAKMPHLLIAGSTGSGKSVSIHTIIASLLYRNAPGNLRLIMIDPKRVELTLYNNIPHLLTPVITDAKKAILALKWAAKEMERRYDILETEAVRDIESYHKNIVEPAYATGGTQEHGSSSETNEDLPEQMPYVVVVIDELADIMTAYSRELEAAIVRLAQMSRAVGIHLILSTQRPSVDVITGLIKANIPARMAFQVTSQTDSRTVLDMGGAEKLLGAGDMLYISGEMSKPIRLQAAFISENEIKKVANYLKKEYDKASYEIDIGSGEEGKDSLLDIMENSENDNEEDDDLYEDARETVIRSGKASTTYLQRKLRVGYARAARLMDILEERGVIGPGEGAKPREVLTRSMDEGYGQENPDNEKGL